MRPPRSGSFGCYLQPPLRTRSAGMTLVEVTVVMAIIAIMMGVGIAGLSNMSTPRRQTAVTTLKGTLDQARAHAIATRKYVALMVVDGVPPESVEPLNLCKYAVFEVGSPGTDGQYATDSKQVTEWKSLPDGVCFAKGLAGKPTILDLPLTLDQYRVRGISGAGYPEVELRFMSGNTFKMLPGIVFAPNGAVATPRLSAVVQNLDVLLVEGRVDAAGTATSVTPSHNPPRIEGVRMTRLTGISRYYDDTAAGASTPPTP
ncbi:pilus assembly FimT family protein [Verrucomicrobium spinosum]|uniref:pilus assembly FimT family protein n=1 Tax=Verrucomicrobium spinosum TaxID=2736 RepID=UPI0009D6F369|nr:prepilin-type N-terminal cleavage/methylation domain-containing protein [Verrucomicrobium spinosum]